MPLPPPFTKQQYIALFTAICGATEANKDKSFQEIVDIINGIVSSVIPPGGTAPVAFNFSIDPATELYSVWIVNQDGVGTTSTLLWNSFKTCVFTTFEDGTPVGHKGIDGYVRLQPEDLPTGGNSEVHQGFDGVKRVEVVKVECWKPCYRVSNCKKRCQPCCCSTSDSDEEWYNPQ